MKKSGGVKLIAVIALVALALILSIRPLSGNINLGLDLQGGAQVVLQAVPDAGESVTEEDMRQLVSVMENRVNELGVSEPIIQLEGTDRIIVELAGVDDPEEAIELIGKTAKLEFRDPYGNVILTGADLTDAYAQINSNEIPAKQNQVALEFTKEGADKFFNATAAFVGQIIYIYLDDVVISSPGVDEPIAGGSAIISGGYANFEEASNQAALLRGGALPVDLTVLSKQTVGPTLGADSLDASLGAALIGFVLLFAFMMLYYRGPGLWACISLFVYSMIVLWVLNLIDATLTLTSIAGFILSIGVAVDANIIIFERIREELFHGKSLKASIEAGFKRAFWTIFDSNLTTVIASVVLYYFGTGTIKGFALTLTIGIIASMFTAITFTRYMLRWMSDVDFLANKKLYGNLDSNKLLGHKEFKFNFIGKKKLFYLIALIVIVPGLIVMIFVGMNQGIDFTGGSILEVNYAESTELADVRDIVNENVTQNPSVNESEDNHFLIRSEELTEEQNAALIDGLSSLGEMEVVRSTLIGPTIGSELLRNARLALIIAGILMLAYITLRFKFNYALTAICALAHDVLVMLSVVTIFRIEIDSAFIAAMLTVIGYSINNTIVVYDRIRENTGLMGRATPAELINTSINQTLTRSLNTTLAVLLLLVSLFLFGGDTTQNFLLTLIVGICAGFFSSVFLAGNILNDLSARMGGFGNTRKRSRTVKNKRTVPVKRNEAAKDNAR